MKEILLCKYGEIILKGANRRYFEDMLERQLKRKARAHGNFNVYRAQSTLYVEPLDEAADMDGMLADACRVFGIISIARAAVCEKSMESICATVKQYIPPALAGKRSFKVEAKRSDKRFPLDSMQIAAEAGAAVLESVPGGRASPGRHRARGGARVRRLCPRRLCQGRRRYAGRHQRAGTSASVRGH